MGSCISVNMEMTRSRGGVVWLSLWRQRSYHHGDGSLSRSMDRRRFQMSECTNVCLLRQRRGPCVSSQMSISLYRLNNVSLCASFHMFIFRLKHDVVSEGNHNRVDVMTWNWTWHRKWRPGLKYFSPFNIYVMMWLKTRIQNRANHSASEGNVSSHYL